MNAALPFIASALEAGGKVLVHCERGVSRSASVVAAFLMDMDPALTPSAAVERVRACRPCVKPNPGFLAQLEARRWSTPLHKRGHDEDEDGTARKKRFSEHLTAADLNAWITAQGYEEEDVAYEHDPVPCERTGEWLAEASPPVPIEP